MRKLYWYLRRFRVLSPFIGLVSAVAKPVRRRFVALRDRSQTKLIGPSIGDVGTVDAGTFSGKEFGVNVSGYFTSEKGMGEASRSDVRSLRAGGIPFVLSNVTDMLSKNIDRRFDEYMDESNPYPVNLIHINAGELPAFFRSKDASYFDGRYNIAYWTWELSRFPDEWVQNARLVHEIWVPSSFVQEAVSSAASIPVIVMPHSIELPKEEEGVEGTVQRDVMQVLGMGRGGGKSRFTFLTIFDFHSMMARKNPEAAIAAYRLAFEAGDGCMLIIKTAHGDVYPKELSYLKRLAEGRQDIQIVDKVLPREEVWNIMSGCDCYVSLHRSEGFGLTIAEAMALGKPVVATGYSGNMDFMTPLNSYPVKYNLIDIERDYVVYRKGSVWADADVESAAHAMRSIYDDYDAAKKIGEAATRDVRELFNPEVIGGRIRKRLEEVLEIG